MKTTTRFIRPRTQNRLIAAIALGACATAAAQDHQPLEKARQTAEAIAARAPRMENAPVRVRVDPDKPYLITGGDNLGALVIPDKKLAALKTFDDADKIVPVGQFWMRGLAPRVKGSTLGGDRLRVVDIQANDEDIELTAYLLGVEKKGEQTNLLVYGKEKEPIARLKLRKSKTYQDLPLELDAVGDGGSSATLYFNLIGGYVAEMAVAQRQ